MRTFMIALLLTLSLCGRAEAGIQEVLAGAWNIVPAAITIVNNGIHLVCGTVHNAVHGLAAGLKVDLSASEPTPTEAPHE